jgi:Rps23 Pro-64 3,4-dihydroxylase Tpa1-like proline 4-hydroxylase
MNLLAEGAYIGKISDLLSDSEYSHFVNQSKIARDLIQSNRNLLTCKYDYSDRKEDDDHSISISKVQERDEYVEENHLSIHQKWYYLNNGNLPNEYFRDLSILITKKHYPDFTGDLSDRFWGNATFSLYEEGNFIDEHRDGLDPDRLCVVLIYFSDPDSYKKSSGGELVITTAHGEIKMVDPILGNYCILDFSQNNLEHEVLKVNDEFQRYTYIHFIESDNFVEILSDHKKKLSMIEYREESMIEKIRCLEESNEDLIKKIEILNKEITILKDGLINRKNRLI